MFAEYVASQQENEDQAEDHANYINGHAFAKDQDKVALHQQAIFAAVVDLTDMMIKLFRNSLFDTSAHSERPHHFTLGLGTVLSLQSGRLQTGVSLIRFRWDDLGRLLDFPSGMLDIAIIALLAAEGHEPIIISRDDVVGVP